MPWPRTGSDTEIGVQIKDLFAEKIYGSRPALHTTIGGRSDGQVSCWPHSMLETYLESLNLMVSNEGTASGTVEELSDLRRSIGQGSWPRKPTSGITIRLEIMIDKKTRSILGD